jgi:hypothetical protein
MIDAIRREVARLLAQLVVVDAGEVKEIRWAEQMARVRLATSGQLSGWLRIGAAAAWDQGGSASPLRVGDEVVCLFLDGRPGGAGFVVARLYGACALPSGLEEQGFGWKQGTKKVLFDGDGKIVCEVAGCSLQSAGEVSIDGSVVKLGGGSADAVRFGELQTALNALVLLLSTHTHICTAPGTPSGTALPVPTLVLAPARALKVKVS